jgi:hypothetical protein
VWRSLLGIVAGSMGMVLLAYSLVAPVLYVIQDQPKGRGSGTIWLLPLIGVPLALWMLAWTIEQWRRR